VLRGRGHGYRVDIDSEETLPRIGTEARSDAAAGRNEEGAVTARGVEHPQAVGRRSRREDGLERLIEDVLHNRRGGVPRSERPSGLSVH
jgi:hypothetical protein